MIQSWLIAGDEAGGVTGPVSLAVDTMRLSLHVISKAGFGQDMLWPYEQERRLGPGGSDQLAPGHDMSFTDAMRTFLHNAIFVLILPEWLRGRTGDPRFEVHSR